jgi:hypothetical protein
MNNGGNRAMAMSVASKQATRRFCRTSYFFSTGEWGRISGTTLSRNSSAAMLRIWLAGPFPSSRHWIWAPEPVGGEFQIRPVSHKDPILPLQKYERDQLCGVEVTTLINIAAVPQVRLDLSRRAQSLSADDFKQFEYLDNTRSRPDS